MYADINKHTGMTTTPLEHVQQCIADIITTPLVSRLMRRHYGSELFDLVDAGQNATNRVRLYSAVATAIYQWEPRVQLSRVTLADADQNATPNANANGVIVFEIEGTAQVGGQTYQLDGTRISYE